MTNVWKVAIGGCGVWLFCLFLFFLSACSEDTSISNILIENDLLAVQINLVGAELQSIRTKKSKREYLWQGDSSTWEDRSPIMFPVNVRFRENRFTYRGDTFEMPRMGLAIKAPFDPVQVATDQCTLQFESNENTLHYYPFPFRLEVRYSLQDNRIINEFTVTNQGADTLYFALGGHPGFRFPFEEYPHRHYYAYSFSQPMTVSRIEIRESLVQPNIIPLLDEEDRLFLVDSRIPANGSGIFLKNVQARRIGLSIGDQQPFVEIELEDFPNVNLWSPPGRSYACIEPMLSHHDLADGPLAIEKKTHLITLPGDSAKIYRYSIAIF